jgi:hypothetical protein
MEEYWTIGHRNPHRISVDAASGRIWAGEVGESLVEEVNVLVGGGNYGWPYLEGSAPGPHWPVPPTYTGTLTAPVIEIDHPEAFAIIGGYVYHGSTFPELTGRYIAGDYVTASVWAIDLDPVTMTATKELLTNFTPGSLATFGQDNDGEILMGSVSLDVPLQRLSPSGTPDPPALLSQIGAFTNMQSLELHPAALPFEPDKFWSDDSGKLRWIFVPNDGTHDQPDEQIVFSETDNWSFPAGTVLMKHFDLGLDEANPSVQTKLETRFLVLGTDGDWYGVTYRWRPDQLDADLLTSAETADYTIALAGGGTRIQTWNFPSRGQCMTCHNSGTAGPVGPRTHQLNRDYTYAATGRTDNQLRTWNHLGIFSPALNEGDIPGYLSAKSVNDASAPLELRARSYIDTNCSYCHRPETGNRAAFDGRLTTPLASQAMIWGPVIDTLGLPDPYLVKPGDPLNSVIHHRVALVGTEAMPPLAKNLVDDAGAALLDAWIQRLDPAAYPVPGVGYEYYEETGLSALPSFGALTPVDTGVTSGFDISPRLRDDDFAFRFTGVVDVPADGDWTFYTSSDEGSQLFIDSALVVDNDGLHPVTEASGTLFLSAGHRDIVVTMFEATGTEVLNVSWEGPGTTKQLLPTGSLFQQAPTTTTNAPPVLTNPGSQGSSLGDVISLPVSASDPDSDPLFFTADGLPFGLAIDADTGLIQGTLGTGSPGTHNVTVGVSDGPTAVSGTFVWTVVDTTDPVVTLIAPQPGATVGGSSVLVQATASDAGGVAGVQFLLDGAPLGPEDLLPPYEVSWDTRLHADGAYVLSAQARDTAGNTGLAANVNVTVDNAALAPVAAWAFDENSGSLASDATGHGHDGAVSGAAWTTEGRFGAALLFDGSDDVVVVPDDDALDLSGAMTLSAWVYPTQAPSSWAAILQKEVDAYMLHASSSDDRGAAGGATLGGVCCTMIFTGSTPPIDTWSHLAVTYDGAQLVYYVDGVVAAITSASGTIEPSTTPLRIGNNTYTGEGFAGRIDEVRVYDWALGENDIQADLATPVPEPSGLMLLASGLAGLIVIARARRVL